MEWADPTEPHRDMGWHTESTLPSYAPALAQLGGMDPHLPQEGEWWVLWGGGGSWTSPLGVGKLCCLSPAWPQQHPPAGHEDFSCEELLSLMRSTCKKGGSKDLSSSR